MTDETAEAIYHATIMERARRPRHQGKLEGAEAQGEARNPLCGDRVSVQLTRTAEGRIATFAYQSRACAICTASADLMAEIVPGMTAEDVSAAATQFEAALRKNQPLAAGNPLACFQPLSSVPSRISCATLGWTALLSALKDSP